MCGICGVVNFDNRAPVGSDLLHRMTDALAHRGPDEEGFFRQRNVGLGHRRLSIIDLAGGQQPIFNEDRTAVIVFNGEVYNYRGLASDLVSRGHRFQTRSDTEAIVHAYEEYGDDCVKHLRGMFTFAVWDERRNRLLLARDRLGIKPLYYYRGASFLAFASELKALLEIPEIPREVDPEALDLYLSLRYVPGPRTMLRDVWKLQPGHVLSVEGDQVRIQEYWDVPHDPVLDISEEEAVAEFQRLLHESVRLRLVAEVPLGVFLSGGIDSSAILAVMSEITGGQRIKTFSVGYAANTPEEDASNEFEYARLAAQTFGSEHHECRVGAQEFCDAIPRLVWHLDEPLADPSCIPLYFLSQLARKHITVVLSGEGADEALGGYGIYKRMALLEKLRVAAGSVGRELIRQAGPLVLDQGVGRYFRMAGEALEERYHGVSRAFSPENKRDLLGITHGGCRFPGTNLANRHFHRYWQAREGSDPLTRMLYVDTKVWLPDDILLKADKMTMAHALELRVPFLDHKLVEFASRLPSKFKLHRGRGKHLLREAMRKVLPEPILKRPKKGFPVPTEGWLRGPLKGYVRETLLSRDSACQGYLDRAAMEKVLGENESGRVNRHQEIWALLVFESWHKTFLQTRRANASEPALEVV